MKTIYLFIHVQFQVKGLIAAAILLIAFHLSSTIICLILINLSQTVTVQFNGQIEQGWVQFSLG